MEPQFAAAVIGNSPIGITLASRLMHLGVNVTLVGRKNPLSLMNRMEAWHQDFCLEVNALSQTDWAKFQIVFFCLRSYDLFGAFDRYLSYMKKDIPIICLAPGAIIRKLHETEKNFPQFRWRIAFTTWKPTHISSGYYRLEARAEDRFYWGPLHGAQSQVHGKIALAPSEAHLLELDSQKHLQWLTDILPLHHKHWIFTTVIHGLCSQSNLAMPQELLKNLPDLKEVFLESFALSQEMWGAWAKDTPTNLFGELVAYISLQPMRMTMMQEDLLYLGRTESQVFAGMNILRRSYPKLKKIHDDIQAKSSQKPRGD